MLKPCTADRLPRHSIPAGGVGTRAVPDRKRAFLRWTKSEGPPSASTLARTSSPMRSKLLAVALSLSPPDSSPPRSRKYSSMPTRSPVPPLVVRVIAVPTPCVAHARDARTRCESVPDGPARAGCRSRAGGCPDRGRVGRRAVPDAGVGPGPGRTEASVAGHARGLDPGAIDLTARVSHAGDQPTLSQSPGLRRPPGRPGWALADARGHAQAAQPAEGGRDTLPSERDSAARHDSAAGPR